MFEINGFHTVVQRMYHTEYGLQDANKFINDVLDNHANGEPFITKLLTDMRGTVSLLIQNTAIMRDYCNRTEKEWLESPEHLMNE
jgi:hypothetical protein